MIDPLMDAASRVDVIETAARIIANPRRATTGASVAEVLALACAVEKLWAVCLEAELLAEVLKLGGSACDGPVQQQINAITNMMAALRGTNESEEAHG